MRLRNVKNKKEIMEACSILVPGSELKGKWHEEFGNHNPIYVEIGMGKGDFIINNALNYPSINFIGIEKYDSVLARAVKKVPQDITNLRLVRMDAKNINDLFDREVDRLYLNFSDPWPKDRHYKRRLTSSVFLDMYDKIFKNNCEIHQKTDNRKLFEFSLMSYVDKDYKICDLSLDLHNDGREGITMSEYEKKYVAKGDVIYFVVVKK